MHGNRRAREAAPETAIFPETTDRSAATPACHKAQAHAVLSGSHCGGDEPSRQTATIIGNQLQLKVKPSNGLREMDLGHWEGLTIDAFKERFGKVYKQWRSDPLSVEPPEGESIAQMLPRVKKALARVVKKNGNKKAVAIVLGGYAYAALLCDLRDRHYENFWPYVEGDVPSAKLATLPIDELALEVTSAVS